MGSKSKNFYSKWAKKNRQREQLGLPPLPRPEFRPAESGSAPMPPRSETAKATSQQPARKRKRSRKPAKDGAAKARVPAASAASGPVKSTPESIEQPQDYEFATDGVSYAALDEMGLGVSDGEGGGNGESDSEGESQEGVEMKEGQVWEEEGDEVREGMDGNGRADKEREDAEVDENASSVESTTERGATPKAQVALADDFEMIDLTTSPQAIVETTPPSSPAESTPPPSPPPALEIYIDLPTLKNTTWSPSSLPSAHLPIPEPATTEKERRAFFEETARQIAIESQRSDRTIEILTKHIEQHGRVQPHSLPESVMSDRIASCERIAELYRKCGGKIRGIHLLGHNPAKETHAVINPATDSALVVDNAKPPGTAVKFQSIARKVSSYSLIDFMQSGLEVIPELINRQSNKFPSEIQEMSGVAELRTEVRNAPPKGSKFFVAQRMELVEGSVFVVAARRGKRPSAKVQQWTPFGAPMRKMNFRV
ncbi:hypothetical protein NCC49_003700 [Naganishia albida]|nr:hypothetical protein NCC49_003700 [Naganishia albida]